MGASTQLRYRSSGAHASGKPRPNSPFFIATLIDSSSLPRGLRHTLAAWYRAAGCPTGSNNEIDLFIAGKGIEIEAQIAERTRRYHVRRLEKYGAVTQTYTANARIRPDYFRHTATHRLNVSMLQKYQRQSYGEYRQSRPVSHPKGPQPVRPETPPPMPPQPARPQEPKPAAETSPATSVHSHAPSAHPRTRALGVRETAKLMARIAQLMKGNAGNVNTPHGLRFVAPNEPDYREPLAKYQATLQACRELGLPIESGMNTLILSGHKITPDGDP